MTKLSGSNTPKEPSPRTTEVEGTPSSSKTSSGLKAVVLAAVVTAAVGAILSPQFIGGAADLVRGSPSEQRETSGQESAPTRLVRKQIGNEALSFLAPEDWPVTRSKVTLVGEPVGGGQLSFAEVPGSAIAAGPRADKSNSAGDSRFYVAASMHTARTLRIRDAADPAEILRTELRKADWSLDGCQLDAESALSTAALEGFYRRWVGCNAAPSLVLIELWGVSPDRASMVAAQFDHGKDIDEETEKKMISSIVLDGAKLAAIESKVTSDGGDNISGSLVGP